MRRYELQVRKEVMDDIGDIKDFIVSKTSLANAERYAAELYAEMWSLTFLADFIKVSDIQAAKVYSKREKVLVTKNKKWSIFFHTYRNIVVVDKITPSKMVKN